MRKKRKPIIMPIMKNRSYDILFAALSILLLSVQTATAEDGSTIIQGSSCEQIKQDESKSTARARATDKASFKAISDMASLSRYKNEMDSHDFNVLVYQIVDNYIEDLSTKTTEQTTDKICVAVSGYVSQNNVQQAVDEFFSAQSQPAQANNISAEETSAMSEAITQELAQAQQNLQQKQQEELKQKEVVFAGDTSDATLKTENSAREDMQPLSTNLPQDMAQDMTEALTAPTYQDATAAPKAQQADAAQNQPKDSVLVYVDPLSFYDNSTSEAYADIIKDYLKQDSHILITENKNLAEYILTPKVLRAKVEAVNHETNRLQMVVSLDMYDVSAEKNLTEHRNRFIVYKTSADEQQVAYELMQNLFDDTSRQMLNIINNNQQKRATENWGKDVLPSIITPAKEYSPKAYVEPLPTR